MPGTLTALGYGGAAAGASAGAAGTVGTTVTAGLTAGTVGSAASAGAAVAGGTAAAGLTAGQVAAISLAVGALTSGLSALLAPKPGAGGQTQTIKLPVAPRRRGYGRYRTGGALCFAKRSIVGFNDNTDGDGILYMGYAINQGEIDAFEKHFIQGEETRVDHAASSNANGIMEVCFPALAEADKPPASEVWITAYDPGYTAETVTAHYTTIGGDPATLDSISVGVIGGIYASVVFPAISADNLKPLATGVTFTSTGAGTGLSMAAIPNSADLWDGGHHVRILDGGSGYADTVGGYGAAIYPQRNGVGRWDGGCTPDNVTIADYGQDYSAPVITAHWMVGMVEHTLQATSSTIGNGSGLPFAGGNVIYPGVFHDNGRVTISEHYGLATQDADEMLLAAFPALWTHQHRLDGVAYVVMRYLGIGIEDFNKVYKFGVPSYSAVIRASKIWDPRDPAQSYEDPTTWTWSDNAALVILDYLTHRDGMRLPTALVHADIAAWQTVADFADEQVTLLSGDTEARYRLWGSYELAESPKTVLGRMLVCVDGRLRLSENGAIVLDLGQFDCPTSCETIDAADILAIDGFRRGAPKDTLKNEIRGKYLSPGHDFNEQEADPWRDNASIIRDGLSTMELDLTYTPSHRQARLRMKIESYRQNPEWQGVIRTNAKGLRLLGKRYARFKIAQLGLNETFFILRSEIDMLERGVCTFRVISFPAEGYCLEPCEEGVSPEHSAPGNHGICIPQNTIGVRIRAIGGGGGGSEDTGGGGGGYAVKYIALTPADWGLVILFTVGAAGIGTVENILGNNTNGGASTVVGSVAAGAIAMTANGGGGGFSGAGAGGTATGGDTNTPGTSTDTGDGGLSGAGTNESESPGGGGHEQVDGGIGAVTFEWEFAT